MAGVSSPLRRRGRALECAIVEAVLGLLREGGYQAVTMEGVAARARTGKAALYRRWESRAHLVADVIARSLPQIDDVPDHGNVRDDLLDVLRRLATLVNSPTGCVVSTLTGDHETEAVFRDLIGGRVVEPQLRIMSEILQRGIDRGEVRPGAHIALIAEVGPSLLLKRCLADRLPVADGYVVSVVDDVLMPILR